jgi:beta-galactosidase
VALDDTRRRWLDPAVVHRNRLLDIDVRTPLDRTSVNGTLRLRVSVGGPIDGHRVRVRCSSATQTDLLDTVIPLDADGTCALNHPMGPVRRWFAEDPYLHHLTVDLVDSGGEVLDSTGSRVGFREVRVAGGRFLVNGCPTEVRGVTHRLARRAPGGPDVGGQMRDELALLKRHNVNAVRLVDGPPDHPFLDLCDELGLYVVIDATTVSRHLSDGTDGTGEPGSGEVAHGLAADAVMRMIGRDRNHPSVVAWGLGGDAQWGPALGEVARRAHESDPTRPLHHPSADHDPAVGIVAPDDPTVEDLRRLAGLDDERPVVVGWYCRSDGNATGNLVEYWELIRSEPRLAGGFVDRGELVTGGDEPSPALATLGQVLSPVGLSAPRAGEDIDEVLVENRHQFVDLGIYRFEWALETDGEPTQSGVLDPGLVLAGRSVTMQVPVDRSSLTHGVEHWVTVTARRRNRTSWADADHPVAHHQYRVRVPHGATSALLTRVHGDLEYHLSPDTGGLASLRVHGNELLTGPSRIWLTRAPTSNDRASAGPHQLGRRWTAAGYDRLRTVVHSLTSPAGAAESEVELGCEETGVSFGFRTRYEAIDGLLVVTTWFAPSPDNPPGLPPPARLGHRLELSPLLDRFEWFGPGPAETYSDRCLGHRIGRWSGSTGAQRFPYEVPQESGNHHDTRWAALLTEGGLGIVVFGDLPLDVNAGRHDEPVVATAARHNELTESGAVYLHVDHRHSGVGGGAPGSGVLEPHQVAVAPTAWRWAIAPVAVGADPAALYGAGMPGPPVTSPVR